MHDLSLLVNIAVALAYALVAGALAKRASLPPLVGYLLAGVAMGPHSPGFVGDYKAIGQLAELGVVLLMFGVGLHFSLNDLWAVRNIAIPGAILQMAIATGVGYLLARSWGWAPGGSVILGIAISVASTVVLLRALMDRALLDSVHGRVAVGWLVLEDLATVAILVLLPLMVGHGSSGGARIAAVAIGKAFVFIALMLVFGKRLIPWLLQRVVGLRSRELFILLALTVAVGTALLSAFWFGVSMALGAFVAGVVVSESPYGHQVGADLLPFREAFAVIFFVSVGMLVDPPLVLAHWREVIALCALVIVGKATIAACAGFAFPYPARTALIVAAGLSQIGEFSFIVGQAGVTMGLLDSTQYSLILAAAVVSIAANPLMFGLVDPIERRLSATPLWPWLNRHGPSGPVRRTRLEGHVVIVGSGRVGRHVAEVLGRLGAPRLVVESDAGVVDTLGRLGVPTLFGDAANSEILAHAGLEHARALVVTVPDEAAAAIVVATARARAPHLHIVARAATWHGARHLTDAGAEDIVRPELEGGLQMLRRTLLFLDYPPRRIQEYADAIRREEMTPTHGGAATRLLDQLATTDLDLQWFNVPHASRLDACAIADATLRSDTGVSIVAVSRNGVVLSTPAPEFVLHVDDQVAVVGTAAQLDMARQWIAAAPAAAT